jgi:hypothetical protein
MYCSNDDGDDCTKDDANMRKGLPALGARFFALEPLFKQVATLCGAHGIALPCRGVTILPRRSVIPRQRSD